MSKFRVEFVGSFAGKVVVYGFSVVEGCCPPLFSRSGCTAIGAVIDCEQHTLSSRKLKVKAYGLGQESGHYTLPVDEVSEPVQLPDDFSIPSGMDISMLCSSVLRCQEDPSRHETCSSNAPHGRGVDPAMQAVQVPGPPDPRLPTHYGGVGRQLQEGRASHGLTSGYGPRGGEPQTEDGP